MGCGRDALGILLSRKEGFDTTRTGRMFGANVDSFLHQERAFTQREMSSKSHAQSVVGFGRSTIDYDSETDENAP